MSKNKNKNNNNRNKARNLVSAKRTPLIFTLILVAMTLAVSVLVSHTQQTMLERKVKSLADNTKASLTSDITGLLQAIHRMADRWQLNQRTAAAVWQQDALNLIKDTHGGLAMMWLDSDLELQQLVSQDGQFKGELNANFHHIDFQKQLSHYQDSHLPQFTPVTTMSDGKHYIHILQATQVNDQFDGFIGMTLDIEIYFKGTVGEHMKDVVILKVLGEGKVLFDGTDETTLAFPGHGFRLDMDDDASGWQVTAYPSQTLYHQYISPWPFITLLVGFIIAALTYFIMKSRLRIKEQGLNLELEIAQRKTVQSQLNHMINHDALTLLPNRAYLKIYLENKIMECQQLGKQLAVLILDVDYFKDINDCWGHATGDQLIKMIAARLKKSMQKGQLLARMDGDEFVICMDGNLIKESMFILADDLLKSLKTPFVINGQTIRITGSIGVSYLHEHGNSGNELLTKASAATYQAKSMGRDTYVEFESSKNKQAINRNHLIQEINDGINKNEFEMFLQPRHEIQSGAMVGAEALVRWRKGNTIRTPDQFLNVAEETGLILEISKQAFGKAFACYHELFKGNPPIQLSINVSAKQLEHPDFINDLFSLMEAHDFPSGMLEIELTEQALIHSFDACTITLGVLSEAGVSIAIDDFGTGYSSLSYLKNFPVDVLKIDRSFINDIHHDKGGLEIVKTIIAMGKNLGMQVVAEGIESLEQLEVLQSEHCHQGQGYYYNKPMEVAQFQALFQSEIKHNGIFNQNH